MDKILVVDFNATAPTYTYYFVRGLQEHGIIVDVLGVENNTFTGVHKENGLNYIGFNFGNKLLSYTANWLRLFAVSKNYQAIHFQWLPMLNYSSVELYLIRILKMIQPNIFYTVHNFFPHDSDIEKIHKRYINLYSILENLVVHTDATAIKIRRKIGPKHIVAIKHGYFFSEFKSSNSVLRTFDLAMIGTILPYKGVEDAIEAVHILHKKNIKVSLLVAGKCSNSYFKTLQDLVEKRNLQDQIVFDIGFLTVPKLLGYYNITRMSVMPYREIEQSGVLYTSLGLGVPVIAYATGGLKDVIITNHNGRLVPQGEIESLAASIEIGIKNWEYWSKNIDEGLHQNDWIKNARILKQVYFK